MIYRTPRLSPLQKAIALVLAAGVPGAAIGLARAGAPEPAAVLVPAAALAPALPAVADILPEEVTVAAARVPALRLDAAAARLRADELAKAERVVDAARRGGAFPGAALAIGRGADAGYLKGLGTTYPGGPRVDADETLYDVASLTKVVATTTAVMLLVEDGKLSIDAPVSRYLPAFSGGNKDRVTLRHLLAHTSGLPAWSAPGSSPQQTLARMIATPLRTAPGAKAEYSDVGFIVLWAAAERAAGEPLAELLDRRLFRPLGMESTRFAPGADCTRCPPTARKSDGSALRGTVHDPIASRLGGVTGNAGLFSTAADMARFAAMMAGEGELDGVRVLKAETVREFTARVRGADTRALGWDTRDERGIGAAGLALSPRAYGHTGFTGTSLWVDPERGTWTVLLTNRTYQPRGPNRMQALRRDVHSSVARAAR
jgi:CubicO group peptidase (beta-lactamase class C family)